MDKLIPVFIKTVTVTRDQLVTFIEVLNKREFIGEDPLTIEEVISKPDLLNYICEQACEGLAFSDPDEFYNEEGWYDIRDYL